MIFFFPKKYALYSNLVLSTYLFKYFEILFTDTTPKAILKRMKMNGITGITREQLKSHLQVKLSKKVKRF